MSAASQSTSTVPPPPTPQGASQPRRTVKLIVLAVVLLGVVVAIVAALKAGGGGSKDEDLPWARVVRGTMLVSITESGEVKAGKRKVISNDLNWSVDIVELAPQGALGDQVSNSFEREFLFLFKNCHVATSLPYGLNRAHISFGGRSHRS